ncbi:sigma-70 family RNA polymerase sigma factor [Pseudogemmobacter humi]|uniref:RNA polymerase sigma factor n=1 Tax=Pseudogemmobacter humi TaxID=2483812 RepID=A0A3P5X1N9_9RHOB|nr:sigma-70 family RNA polymerase sigma factor [Pseudogemmobacter humi]VDC25131.1 ECF RNA polymerase sigma factor SigR [Pseudogemmobacter humi]
MSDRMTGAGTRGPSPPNGLPGRAWQGKSPRPVAANGRPRDRGFARREDTGCNEEIVGHIPALRIFARSLCRNPVEADDLVQETLVRAIGNIRLFRTGTNLRAWLFTIMRNRFYSNWAKRARERTGDGDCVSSIPVASGDRQFWHIRLQEMERALAALPVHYRETIILVAVLGESYLQAAEILGCDIGTIKSRVNRARVALRDRLGDVTPD